MSVGEAGFGRCVEKVVKSLFADAIHRIYVPSPYLPIGDSKSGVLVIYPVDFCDSHLVAFCWQFPGHSVHRGFLWFGLYGRISSVISQLTVTRPLPSHWLQTYVSSFSSPGTLPVPWHIRQSATFGGWVTSLFMPHPPLSWVRQRRFHPGRP